MKGREKMKAIQKNLSKNQYGASMLSHKLLSWAILLQHNGRDGEFDELLGLGLSLEYYSRRLRKLAHSLDQVQVALKNEADYPSRS